ncbi:MAG: type IV-A pilus assembly ATPase PilB [Candidatus Firestonebacteria bacterium]
MAVETMREMLSQMLVDEGVITDAQLQDAVKEQKASGIRFEQALVKLGFATDEVILAFLGNQMGIKTVNLAELGELNVEVVRAVPEGVALKQCVIPIAKNNNKLTVAIADPLNISALDDIKLSTGFEIEPVLASETDIKEAILKYYSTTTQGMEEVMKDLENVEDVEVLEGEKEMDASQLAAASEDAPIVKLVNVMLSEAVKSGASDIHLEPYEKKSRLRYRIDGILHETKSPPKRMHAAIISRVKIMSQLDIAERRRPQDGRAKIKVTGKDVDLRVSILPTVFGEKLVIRILDTGNLQLDLGQLGFESDILQIFKKNIEVPYGMILVTGPTGSGKSTTLYSTLSTLNFPDVNILTIEDPVEFVVSGINQVQANPKAGLTFADGLKSFLRQDPDIIMVGEIRDKETAGIAINAALTGHLVLSTLHTNDAPGAMTRLDNMGIEPFLISSSVVMVIAQRLVRKICPKCKEAYEVSPEVIRELGVIPQGEEKFILYRGMGCDRCSKTGYKGRLSLYEVMPMTDNLRAVVLKRAPGTEIKKVARKDGMVTLREAGIKKVFAGVTTIEELLRVTMADIEQ